MDSFIANVVLDGRDGSAQDIADYWRKQGYRVRIVKRTVRALGLAALVQVIVVAPPAKEAGGVAIPKQEKNMTLDEVLSACKAQVGFLTEEQLAVIAREDPARGVLLRFGAKRKLVLACHVREEIARTTKGGSDYLRDVSLPTTDPLWIEG